MQGEQLTFKYVTLMPLKQSSTVPAILNYKVHASSTRSMEVKVLSYCLTQLINRRLPLPIKSAQKAAHNFYECKSK